MERLRKGRGEGREKVRSGVGEEGRRGRGERAAPTKRRRRKVAALAREENQHLIVREKLILKLLISLLLF